LEDASYRASGALGGGQIGFDYQTGWTCSAFKPTRIWLTFTARSRLVF